MDSTNTQIRGFWTVQTQRSEEFGQYRHRDQRVLDSTNTEIRGVLDSTNTDFGQ